MLKPRVLVILHHELHLFSFVKMIDVKDIVDENSRLCFNLNLNKDLLIVDVLSSHLLLHHSGFYQLLLYSVHT